MPKDLSITSENFEKLLDWLDPDRVQAAVKYEHIRSRLIRIFSCRGCFDAEDLADKTFDRVIRKINEVRNSVEAGPASYLYGVASNIYFESMRERSRFSEFKPEISPHWEHTGEAGEDKQITCLGKCLNEISGINKALVLDYYRGERSEKIANRHALAKRLKISANALQVKVLRLRSGLKNCVADCVRNGAV